MELIHIKDELANRLTQSRFEHVLRVTELAKSLATKHGVSVQAAEQAALLHDIAKCTNRDVLRKQLKEMNGDERLFSYHHELWHGPVGAHIAITEFGIEDEDILNAIRFHTTGRANMSTLEKIIYVADMIEPGRNYPGVDRLRENANGDIDIAMLYCICHSIEFLVQRRVAVFPDSFDCYNEFVRRDM